MDSFILAYIAHRMEMLGFKKYSMEPLLLTWSYGGISEYVIQAQNEYYYLVSKTVNEGTEIMADNAKTSAAATVETAKVLAATEAAEKI